MTIIAKTTRLILRTVRLGDAELSFAIYSDPKVMKWLDDERPFSRIEQSKADIERGMDCQRLNGVSHWAVILKSSGLLIGHCGFHPVNAESSDLELVVHFNRGFWNRGYATEAARAACKYAFEKCSAGRIIALTMPENIRSQKLLTRVGFTKIEPITEVSSDYARADVLLRYEMEMRSTDRKEDRSG